MSSQSMAKTTRVDSPKGYVKRVHFAKVRTSVWFNDGVTCSIDLVARNYQCTIVPVLVDLVQSVPENKHIKYAC